MKKARVQASSDESMIQHPSDFTVKAEPKVVLYDAKGTPLIRLIWFYGPVRLTTHQES